MELLGWITGLAFFAGIAALDYLICWLCQEGGNDENT